MLSLEQCRVLLGKDCALPDSEVEQIQSSLYSLADVFLEAMKGKSESDINRKSLSTKLNHGENIELNKKFSVLKFNEDTPRRKKEMLSLKGILVNGDGYV